MNRHQKKQRTANIAKCYQTNSKMENLNTIEVAARNKANYLKAKEAFNNKRIDDCILYYAQNHEVKSKQVKKEEKEYKSF